MSSIYASAKKKSFGDELVLSNVKAERSLNIVYTNTKELPIVLSVSLLANSPSTWTCLYIEIDGIVSFYSGADTQTRRVAGTVIIPPGSTYKVYQVYTGVIETWVEM